MNIPRPHPVGICKYGRGQAAPTLVLRHPTVESCTIGDRRRGNAPIDRARLAIYRRRSGVSRTTPRSDLAATGGLVRSKSSREMRKTICYRRHEVSTEHHEANTLGERWTNAVVFGAAENAERRRNAPGSRGPLWIRPPHEFARYHAFKALLGALLQATTPASGES